VRVCLAALLLPVLALAASPGDRLYKDARNAERAGDIVRAFLLYSQAAAAEPANLAYWTKAMALRPAASLQATNNSTVTDTGLAKPKLNSDLFGKITERDLDEARQPLPPAELDAAPDRKDLDLRGDAKALFDEFARAYKLQVVYDSAYQAGQTIRFRLSDAGYREALRALQAATNSFVVPVSTRLLFVANDTPQKRTEFERTASAVIPIPEPFSIQEVQEIVTGVRGTLDIQRMFVDTQRRLVLVRDRAAKVRIARLLFEDLMQRRPQVAIDIEILSADETSSLHFGLSLPTSFPLVWFGKGPKNLLRSIPAGFVNYLGFGGGASLLGLGVTNASLFATVTKASATTLLSSELVTLDGQPASFHVGDRYPIQSNVYIGNTSGTGQVFTPPPTFTFEDLGLVLKITPHVHGMDEVSLEVNAEFKLLGAAAVDGIPIISNRKFESKVRVGNGEWAVLAGLINAREARAITGIPGLTLVPFLRENSRSKDRSDTLIVLKPRLLSLPPTEAMTHAAWVGSDSRPRSDL
jgi:hypothetical protein